jgi:hypothetical protein
LSLVHLRVASQRAGDSAKPGAGSLDSRRCRKLDKDT